MRGMITLDDFEFNEQVQASQAEAVQAVRALSELIKRILSKEPPEDPKEKCAKHNKAVLHEKNFFKMISGEMDKPIKVVYEGPNTWETYPDCVGTIPNLHVYSSTTSG